MSRDRNILRWLAIMVAFVLLAAACSSDGPNLADVADNSVSQDPVSEDSVSEDPVSGGADTGGAPESGETAPSDDVAPETSDSETTPDIESSDLPPEALASTSCADIEAAFASLGGLASGGLGAPDGTDLEADFENYRAGLEALRSGAPELGDDIDAALAGLEVIGAAMAEFDWDINNLSDPQDAAALAAVMTDSDAMGMLEAMTSIATWVAGNCVG
jgi:hypothetical protein